jgi:hypothetical protein
LNGFQLGSKDIGCKGEAVVQWRNHLN